MSAKTPSMQVSFDVNWRYVRITMQPHIAKQWFHGTLSNKHMSGSNLCPHVIDQLAVTGRIVNVNTYSQSSQWKRRSYHAQKLEQNAANRQQSSLSNWQRCGNIVCTVFLRFFSNVAGIHVVDSSHIRGLRVTFMDSHFKTNGFTKRRQFNNVLKVV